MIVFEANGDNCKILWKGGFAKCMRFVKDYIDENYGNTVFKKYFDYNDYIRENYDEYTCFCERTDRFVRFRIYSYSVDPEIDLFVWYSEVLPKKATEIYPELSELSKGPLFTNQNLLFFDTMELMKYLADFAEEFDGEINNSWYGEYCVFVNLDPYDNSAMDEWLEKNLPKEFDYEYVYNNGDEIIDHVQFGIRTEASRYFSLNGVAAIKNDNLKYHVGKTAIVVYDNKFYYVWGIPNEEDRNHRINCPTAWFCRCPKPENFEDLLKLI